MLPPVAGDLGFEAVDADNHYYESLDAFTRHLDKRFRERGVQVLRDGKRVHVVIGGEVNRFIPNPTFDPIIVPGCIDLMFRGQIPEGTDPRQLMKVEPLAEHPEYRDREARQQVAAEQGLEAVLLFPTLGCGVEEALKGDVDATMASLGAFNRWLEEDWGFADGRIIAAPMLSLADPAAALTELDSLIERGARIVHVRPAPVPGGHGTSRSLGDKLHDPVWARLAETGTPVAFHLGDSGYNAFTAMWGGSAKFQAFGKSNVLGQFIVADRAIHDTMASLVIDGVFRRHPTLKVASIENGSDWVALLVKRLRKQANQTPWVFEEDPLEQIRRNVWVTPYYEDDIRALADLIGVERVLFGSDWPHGEGLAEPLDFVKELHAFDEAEVRRIMRDNALELLGPTR
jgi:predicted TIM-barrel fold metal-dependent hydrolase